ncbi:MAG: xylose isomerase-like barrel protein [Paenibacillus sp.]|nr:xylose isomerase-like barrel protein [Paenibacillus sp.]
MARNIGMRIPRTIMEKGIAYVAQFASSTGLDVLDVGALNPEVKQQMDRFNLKVGSVDAQGVGSLLSSDGQKRAAASASIRQQITQIAALGAKTMFMCLVPEDRTMARKDTFAIWKEVFPEVVAHAEAHDVSICIEGWPGPAPTFPTIGCTPEMWRAMFEAVPSKHFGLNYDPSHLVWLGVDYMRVLNEFGDRIVHAHGKDTAFLSEERYESGILPPTFGTKYAYSGGSWRYTIPGDGEVNWRQVADKLDQLGYKGPICIELEDNTYHGSLEKEQQGIQQAYAYLAKIFK